MAVAAPPQRILVADDEQVLANTLSIVLRSEGYEVSTVFDGEAAIWAAPEFKPNVLLSDIKMPRVNGVTAAIAIARLLPECKVILMSGHAIAQDLLQESRTLGYEFPLLPKPFHPDALLQQIAALLCSP